MSGGGGVQDHGAYSRARPENQNKGAQSLKTCYDNEVVSKTIRKPKYLGASALSA